MSAILTPEPGSRAPYAASRAHSPVPGYTLAALTFVVLESIPGFDRFFQKAFYANGSWLLSASFHATYRDLLYTAPKIAIGVVGGVFLVASAWLLVRRGSTQRGREWGGSLLLCALAIMLVPLCVAALKSLTGVYSPIDLLPYGGVYPHFGFLEQLVLHGDIAGGRSFPAGHASGGFALMALMYLPLSRWWKRAFFMFGLCAGWAMGLYQMARGQHFMSHTLTTMFLALAIIALLEQIQARAGERFRAPRPGVVE